MANRKDFIFVVKDVGDGNPRIVAEPIADFSGISGEMIGFDLKPGTRLDDAQRLARLMREKIIGLSITQ